jgi:hypothetical protein
VWEEGGQKVPLWILLRHVLVFCYSMGLASIIEPAVWNKWLSTVIRNRSQDLGPIIDAWQSIATGLSKI